MIRLAAIIAFAVLSVAVFARYHAENVAKEKERKIAVAEADIQRQETSIRLLRAEIAHLESPERLATAIAARDEVLAPKTPQQMMSLDEAVRHLNAVETASLPAPKVKPVSEDPMGTFLQNVVIRTSAGD